MRNRPEFAEARDAVLIHLEDCAPDQPQEVIGYAPVLTVISEYLNNGNPLSLLNAARQWTRQEPARLLATVANSILLREQREKSESPLRDVLTVVPAFAAWDTLYTPDEQCLRLLAKESNYALTELPPSNLPLPAREAYETAINEWIEQHPFRKQKVFSEYIYAWFLSHNKIEAALKDTVRGHVTSTYFPTYLLAEFTLALDGGNASTISIDSLDFGFLYDSVVSGRSRGDTIRLFLTRARKPGELEGNLSWYFDRDRSGGVEKPKRIIGLNLRRIPRRPLAMAVIVRGRY